VVPAGQRWVVTDVVVRYAVATYISSPGFIVSRASDGSPIVAITRKMACGNRVYRWSGRQVIQAEDNIQAFNGLGSWQVSVTGFKLTLP
jgi:hypothetical protein